MYYTQQIASRFDSATEYAHQMNIVHEEIGAFLLDNTFE